MIRNPSTRANGVIGMTTSKPETRESAVVSTLINLGVFLQEIAQKLDLEDVRREAQRIVLDPSKECLAEMRGLLSRTLGRGEV